MKPKGLTPGLKKFINNTNEKIQKCMQKQNYTKAITYMQSIIEIEPENPKFLQKMADLYNLVGKREDAIDYYYAVAEKYIKENYLLKSISLLKMIGRLDPTFTYQNTLKAFEKLKKLQVKIKKDSQGLFNEPDDFQYPEVTRILSETLDPSKKENFLKEQPRYDESDNHIEKESGKELIFEPTSYLHADNIPDKIELDMDKAPDFGDITIEVKESDFAVETNEEPKKPQSIPLFEDLELAEFEAILERLVFKSFHEGVDVIRQGVKGDSMFFITSGKVKVSYRDNKGEIHDIAILSDGDFFGEFVLFTGRPRQATVTAITKIELLELSYNDLKDVINRYPSLSQTLFRFYRDRVLETMLTISSVFGSGDRDGIRFLARNFIVKKFPTNTTLLVENEVSQKVYYIKSGKVNLLARTPTNMELLVGSVSSDDLICEMDPEAKNSFTGITAVDSEILMINKIDFIRYIERYPDLRSRIEEISGMRISNKNNLLQPFYDGIPP
jgi:CRP-like cAMP-binding protein